jgi:NAD(P)H dehydrogenase (quinone)
MIAITGATGQLGRLVVTSLLRLVPANELVAAVRTPAKAADLAALGVQVREADYARPETLASAFAGVEKVLLISGNELGQRVSLHKAAIDAAKTAGVKLFAYTSLLRADTSTLMLAAEHKATEEYLRASGLPYIFLRNGWYLENQTASLASALEHGAILGAAGDGLFAAAARQDYAEAAAAALTLPDQENKVYELAGDKPYTLSDLAAEVSRQSGKPVTYQNLPAAAYEKALLGFGLPPEIAAMLADSDAGAARGELTSDSADLRKLIGHPTKTLAAAVTVALKG